jgi:hypothetical protein
MDPWHPLQFFVPLAKNSTFVTEPLLSEAEALIVTFTGKVKKVLFVGEVMLTDGKVLVAGPKSPSSSSSKLISLLVRNVLVDFCSKNVGAVDQRLEDKLPEVINVIVSSLPPIAPLAGVR